jgi:hypothetical protein
MPVLFSLLMLIFQSVRSCFAELGCELCKHQSQRVIPRSKAKYALLLGVVVALAAPPSSHSLTRASK